jgi:hypothetical protein
MARIINRSGEANFSSKELNWGITRVGRGAENDVVINHASISYHHCELELGFDFLLVRDLNSTNGTLVNGSRVTEARIESGQTLRLGEISMMVEWSREQVTVPKVEVSKLPESVALGNGVLSCLKHATIPGVWHCSKCENYFCQSCARDVHLVGRPSRKLCPACSSPVALAPWANGASKKKSIWGRIKKTFSRTSRVG